MGQAEAAHTTGAPGSSFGARVTYNDLNRSDGSIDRSVLMTLAIRRAQHERVECRRLGAARGPAIILDRRAALRRELALLPYREDCHQGTGCRDRGRRGPQFANTTLESILRDIRKLNPAALRSGWQRARAS
jgi:hypothetical protein